MSGIGFVALGYAQLTLSRRATNLRSKLSNKELDDNVLVEQAWEGDRRAFSELVRRHQTVIYRSCYRRREQSGRSSAYFRKPQKGLTLTLTRQALRHPELLP